MEMHQTIEVEGYTLFEKAAMPGNTSHPRALADSSCFMYLLSGQNAAIEPTGRTRINATEGIIKKCGNYVTQFYTSDTFSFCEGVAVYFHPDFIKDIYASEIPSFLRINNPDGYTRKVESNKFIQQYIQNILPYFDNPALMDKELASLKIKELVILLLKSDSRNTVIDFFSELFASPRVLRFSEIVENNLYSGIQIDELAFLCNMSLSTFKREFQKHYQTSPASYIRTRRIERAKKLLQNSDLQIQEIGYQCGFNELSSFSHTFTKIEGTSPTQFRLNQIHK